MATDSAPQTPFKALIDRNEFLTITSVTPVPREIGGGIKTTVHRIRPKDVLAISAVGDRVTIVDKGQYKWQNFYLPGHKLLNGMNIFDAFESIGFAKFEGLDFGDPTDDMKGRNKQKKICVVNPLEIKNQELAHLLSADINYNDMGKAVFVMDGGNERKYLVSVVPKKDFDSLSAMVDRRRHEMIRQIRAEERAEEQQQSGGGGGGQMNSWTDRESGRQADDIPKKLRQTEISMLDRARRTGGKAEIG